MAIRMIRREPAVEIVVMMHLHNVHPHGTSLLKWAHVVLITGIVSGQELPNLNIQLEDGNGGRPYSLTMDHVR